MQWAFVCMTANVCDPSLVFTSLQRFRGQFVCYIIQPEPINIHLTVQRNQCAFVIVLVAVFFVANSLLRLFAHIMCSIMRRNKQTRSLFVYSFMNRTQFLFNCRLSNESYELSNEIYC